MTRTKSVAIALGMLVGLFVYYALTWKSFAAFTVAIDHCDLPFCDFQGHYYPMAQEIFRSGVPVPGFFYSPFAAILLAAFKPLNIGPALIVWGAFQVALLALLAAAPRAFGIRSTPMLLLGVFLVLTAFPVIHNFKWGQISVLLVLSIAACFYWYERGKRFWAACFLALAIALKFFPALFLVYFVLRRDARFTLSCIAISALFLVGIPAVALGWNDTINFYQFLQQSLSLSNNHLFDPNSQYLPNVVRRIAVGLSYDATEPWRQMMAQSMAFQSGLRVVSMAFAVINVAFLFLVLRHTEHLRGMTMSMSTFGFVLLCLTLPLLVHTSWPHYFVYLPICQLLLWREIVGANTGRARQLKIVLLVVPSIVASSIFLFNVMSGLDIALSKGVQERSFYSYWGCLLIANLLLLTALYVEFVPRLRGTDRG